MKHTSFTIFIKDKQAEYDHDITRDYALMIKLAGEYERIILDKLGLPHDWAGWQYGMRWSIWGWTSEHHTHCDDGQLSYVGTYRHTAEHALHRAENQNKEWGRPFRNLFRVPIEYEIFRMKETA